MLFKLINQNGVSFVIGTVNARRSDQVVFSVGSQNDIASLQSAIATATNQNWYNGIPTGVSWLSTAAIFNGPSKQTLLNFGYVNCFDITQLNINDKLYISKVGGSYIKVNNISGSAALGSTLTIYLDYYTADNELVYQTFLTAWGSSSFDNTDLYTFPWLLNLENPGAYYLISAYGRCYSGKMEAALTQNTVGGRYRGITPPTSSTLAAKFWGAVTPIDEDDPYQDIPDSEPSGPAQGTGIPANDPVDFPGLPTVSASDTGFITLYNPTLAQVKSLADYMWTGLFDLATYKKIFADPMDCILGFNMLPVAIPHGTAKSVTVGNISTGVQMDPATSQWVEVDCGSINMDDAFGSYLSYAPYTKVSLYLPYIGTVELSTDDVIGKTISLKYHVDCLSCSCVAYLKCGTSVLYQFTGACGYSIPVNGNDFRSTIGSIVSIAASIGGAVATGGMTAPLTGAKVAAGFASGAGIASNVMNAKPEIHRSGAIGSSAGIMGLQKPYLIVEYPNPCKPKKQYHYIGYPSFVTVKLGDLSGFASFENVILDGIECTDEERQIILAMCQEGIYL